MSTQNTKYTRSQLDDPYRRNNAPDSFKNRQFAGYRVATDRYTGEKIYYSCVGSNHAKGAPRHFTTQTTSNVDHIQPIDVFNARYAGQLSVEDAQRILNSDYNLALTNEALNKAKGGSTNAQYLYKQLKKGSPEDITTSVNMLSAQIEADVHIKIDVEATKLRRNLEAKAHSQATKTALASVEKNATEAIHTGTSAALVTLTVSGLNNLAYVASGEKDIATALRDVGSDTANSAVSAASLQATQKIISGIADKAGAKQLAAITKQQLPVAEIALAAMVVGSVSRYLEGEISGEDCVIEILLNGAGTYAYQLGLLIGGPAGAVIASVITTQITHAILEYRQAQKIHKARAAEIDRVLSCAMAEIKRQQETLQDYVQGELAYWNEEINSGFELIMNSALNEDSAGVANGLNKITALFNRHVLYASLDDFDRDFFNENAPPLVLG